MDHTILFLISSLPSKEEENEKKRQIGMLFCFTFYLAAFNNIALPTCKQIVPACFVKIGRSLQMLINCN